MRLQNFNPFLLLLAALSLALLLENCTFLKAPKAQEKVGKSTFPSMTLRIDFSDPGEVRGYADRMGWTFVREMDAKGNLSCVQRMVFELGATPESVRGVGYFRVPEAGGAPRPICASDAPIPKGWVKQLCKGLGMQPLKAEGPVLYCRWVTA